MLDYFYRKRRQIAAVAVVSAAASAAAYLWCVMGSMRACMHGHARSQNHGHTLRWTWGSDAADADASEVQSKEERHNILQILKEPATRIDGYENGARGLPHGRDEKSSLDQSMDSHFSYIQEVSAPQELDTLLPKLHASLVQVGKPTHVLMRESSLHPSTTLRLSLLPLPFSSAQLTDVKALMSTMATGKPVGGSNSVPTEAADQLRLLARMCFSRALGACWIIPCMDLLVRVKLNIIGPCERLIAWVELQFVVDKIHPRTRVTGKHLFLQEKLGKLKHSGSQAVAVASGGMLPPRLSAAAVEAFLDCRWFVEGGCEWVLEKVAEGVDVVLRGVSLDAEATPAELFKIMASMLSEAEAAMARSRRGGADGASRGAASVSGRDVQDDGAPAGQSDLKRAASVAAVEAGMAAGMAVAAEPEARVAWESLLMGPGSQRQQALHLDPQQGER